MCAGALNCSVAEAAAYSHTAGTARLTTTEALAHCIVSPAIATLRGSHPALQVDLMVGVRTLDIARRDADLAVRFARPTAPELVCRKLGEVGYSLYASRRYLAKRGAPKRGAGLAGYDLITFSGAPAAISPFFMGEALDGVRIAMRCDNALIQVQAAAQTESSPSRRSHSAKNQVKICCQQPIWEVFKVADITRCWVACRRERSRNLGRPIATLQCRILSTPV
jgi:DNA-binding transcriptional LysR family regulator